MIILLRRFVFLKGKIFHQNIKIEQINKKTISYATKSEKHDPNAFIAEVIAGGDVIIVKLIGTYQIKLIAIYHG